MKPKFKIGQTVYYIARDSGFLRICSVVVQGYISHTYVDEEYIEQYLGPYDFKIDVDSYTNRRDADVALADELGDQISKLEAKVVLLKGILTAALVRL